MNLPCASKRSHINKPRAIASPTYHVPWLGSSFERTKTFKNCNDLLLSLSPMHVQVLTKIFSFISNTWFEVLHFARASGEYPEIESEVQNANKAYKMRSLSEWASQEHQSKKDSDEPWNKV